MARPMQAVPGREVLLATELRRPVRRQRTTLRRLGRAPVALAVDRPSGGREDDLCVVPARCLENPQRAEDVDLCIVIGAFHGCPNVRLGGEMQDGVRPDRVEDLVRGANVGHVEDGALGHALPLPRGEVVEDVHLVAACEQGVDDVRADETRAPRDDRPHRPRILGAMGALLAIEGIDGYLNGEFGAADEVHPELAALLYAGDRFHARPRLLAALEQHDLVVCDRYIASNAAHQGAKLTGAARRRLLDWLEEVEYGEFALPRPDLVVLLDAPIALARELVGRKGARGYTTLEADIHEADAGHSGATREVYLELARRDGWRVVPTAAEKGAVREAAEVAADVWSSVEPLLR